MKMAVFESRNGMKIAFPPDKICIVEDPDNKCSRVFEFNTDPKSEGWIVKHTLEEAVKIANIALKG